MRKLVAIAFVVITISSCQKHDPAPDETSLKSVYLPLTVGNYWIYEHFEVESNGNETKLSFQDSLVITKDTLINGYKYFVLEGVKYPFTNQWSVIDIIRDSSKYLVNHDGKTLFSENNFTDTLYQFVDLFNNVDTVYSVFYMMQKPDNSVTVSAGTFDVLNFNGFLKLFYPSNTGVDIVYENLKTYYAPGVGRVLISYKWYSNREKKIERRLVRYRADSE